MSIKTSYDDLPVDIQRALCDMNADLQIAFSCITNPDIFTNADVTLKGRLTDIYVTLQELLSED